MSRIALCVLSAFLALSPAARADDPQPKRRPNVVFILVDDMGWTDAACFGSKFYETPNLDRLAKASVQFTSGYAAAPVCSPTRSSILTGKYPARTGNTDWFGAGKRKGQLNPAPYLNHLPPGELTLAEALRRAGYRTAHIGKWHLGGPGHGPTDHGFDVNVAGTAAGSPKSYFSPFGNPVLPDGPPGEELTDRLTTEALKFIDANKDQPFYLNLWYNAVHTPLQAKKDLVAKYQAKAAKLGEQGKFAPYADTKVRLVHDHAVYAAMVETLDQNVGRLLDHLEKLGLANDTIIVFTSDNGGVATSEGWPTSNRPLRAGKGWLYEGGVRVPFLIRWPGHLTPRQTEVPAISTDFYPTLLDLAGLPAQPKQHVDGASLAPLLRGTGQLAARPLYWHYPHYSNQFGRPSGSVRDGDLVLIEFYEDNRVELYDVVRDLGQTRDLSRDMPERAGQMRTQLRAWREAVGAKMPTRSQ